MRPDSLQRSKRTANQRADAKIYLKLPLFATASARTRVPFGINFRYDSFLSESAEHHPPRHICPRWSKPSAALSRCGNSVTRIERALLRGRWTVHSTALAGGDRRNKTMIASATAISARRAVAIR
jgi:hypothetical protein